MATKCVLISVANIALDDQQFGVLGRIIKWVAIALHTIIRVIYLYDGNAQVHANRILAITFRKYDYMQNIILMAID